MPVTAQGYQSICFCILLSLKVWAFGEKRWYHEEIRQSRFVLLQKPIGRCKRTFLRANNETRIRWNFQVSCLHETPGKFCRICDDCHDDELRKERRVRVSLCGWQVTRRLKGSEKEGNVTIQVPLPHIRISNTSCSFLAFSKAKNAHMGRGSSIRINVWKSILNS